MKRAVALGMSVSAFDPYVTPDGPAWDQPWGRIEPFLEPLIAGSDVVSLHVPLTPETRHLIGADAIARMKADAILINARGGVVDEAAVAEALRAGGLAGRRSTYSRPNPSPRNEERSSQAVPIWC